jgi:hypothetical protein
VIIIKPDTITPAKLTDTNVDEDEYPAWAAGTYDAGDRVIYDHKIWEAIATTTAQPDEGALANPPTWLFVGATNRFSMFDATVGSGTSNADSIDVTITPTAPYNAVVLFGVQASSVQLIIRDSSDAIVYDETQSLADYSSIIGYYTYFFAPLPVDAQSEVTFLDIPLYANATYQLIIDAGTGTAVCAEAVFGLQSNLAITNFGTTVGIKDYSIKQTDAFGNVTIVQRPFSKRAEYDLTVETSQVSLFTRFLADIRAVPVVYIGDPNRSETIVYGYYRDFSVVLSNPSISSCSLTIEGLI